MKSSILILGAGFGGLELSTSVSEALGDSIDITLIDAAEGFVFGFAKLDLRPNPHDVLHKVFGHAEFRGQQGDVVQHIVAGGDAVVLFPTGAG